MNVREKLVSE